MKVKEGFLKEVTIELKHKHELKHKLRAKGWQDWFRQQEEPTLLCGRKKRSEHTKAYEAGAETKS